MQVHEMAISRGGRHMKYDHVRSKENMRKSNLSHGEVLLSRYVDFELIYPRIGEFSDYDIPLAKNNYALLKPSL